jgi:hypothetical protein
MLHLFVFAFDLLAIPIQAGVSGTNAGCLICHSVYLTHKEAKKKRLISSPLPAY